MATPTGNMALSKAVAGDNSKTYLETSLALSLDTLDAHDHSLTDNSKGKPINTIPSGNLIITSGNLAFQAAAARIIPGVTSLTFRDAGNANDNLIITDAGAITIRNTFTANVSSGAGTIAQFSNAALQNVLRLSSNGTFAHGIGDSTGFVGFYGTTPTARQTAIANASDLATAISLVNSLKSQLQVLGLLA